MESKQIIVQEGQIPQQQIQQQQNVLQQQQQSQQENQDFSNKSQIKRQLSRGESSEYYDIYGFESVTQQGVSTSGEKKNLKQENARMEKWRLMLQEITSLVQKQDSKLKERIRKGIPNGLRCKVWPILAEVDKYREQNKNLDFEVLIKHEDFPYEHDIIVDIPRTFPNHQLFKKTQQENVGMESLKNILKALSIAFSEMGYCQGLNFIAAALLIHLNDEQSFWVLYSLMTKYQCIDMYKDVTVVNKYLYVHDQLIKKFLPKISNLFETLQIESIYYATSWYMTLFSAVLPFNLFLRTFDIFFFEGWKIIFRVSLAIIKNKEKEILEARSFDKIMQILKTLDSLAEIEDKLFQSAHQDFVFSKKFIQELENQYELIRIEQQKQKEIAKKQKLIDAQNKIK